MFNKPGTGWSGTLYEDGVLQSSDAGTGDSFGTSVAISGTTIVAGAPSHTVGYNTSEGEAYVFVRPTGGWLPVKR